MAGFLIGFILGAFGLICLALCQVQNQDNVPEKVYFAISTDIEGIKLYLDKKGVYGEFSVTDTLLASSISNLNTIYKDVTGKTMNSDLTVEKMSVTTKHIQSFSQEKE